MGTVTVRTPSEFESQLQQYLFERAEEARAVRVGEKETSEQAEIVRRYSDLFSPAQLDALRHAEHAASGDDRELLFRLMKTCEGGLIAAELAEREDELWSIGWVRLPAGQEPEPMPANFTKLMTSSR